MPFIGNQPAESYASFETETFTVSATANYTLSHAVTNENEIRLVINGVVQQPGSGKAYTASSTTLTLTSATVSGDVMYAVYLGRALQTVNPPAASVGNSQTAPTIITGQTAETSIATDDTILIHDTSASALRKMTRANFVSGIGGTNTPAFKVYANSAQSLSSGVTSTVVFGVESYDTDNAFASNKFTVPSGKAGKYTFTGSFYSAVDNGTLSELLLFITKNGSSAAETAVDFRNNNDGADNGIVLTTSLDLAVSDYIELKVYVVATNPAGRSGENLIYFTGHKLIT